MNSALNKLIFLIKEIEKKKLIYLDVVSPVRPFFALFLEKPLLYVVSDREKRKKVVSQLEALQSVAGKPFLVEGVKREEEFFGVKLQSNFRQKEVVAVVEAQDLHLEVEDLDYFLTHSFLLEKGKETRREEFLDLLFSLGYERQELVRERGEVAIRGEVVDLFPPHLPLPVRTYWWGNQIEKMKFFRPESQRTEEEVKTLFIPPRSGEFKTVPLFSSLKKEVKTIFWDGVIVEDLTLSSRQVFSGIGTQEAQVSFSLEVERIPSFWGKIDDLKDYLETSLWNKIFLLLPPEKLEILSSLLEEEKVDFGLNLEENKKVILFPGYLREGFGIPEIGLAFISSWEIFGKEFVPSPEVPKKSLVSLSSLSPGDYVVHEEEGIGIFRGWKEMTVEGIKRVYVEIEYGRGDILYLPADKIYLLQKYVGAGEEKPRINRLGKDEWARTKERAKRAAEKVAQDLVEVYARRQLEEGYSFSPDTPWQKELELSFPFLETPDQKKAIEEVKKDMESPRPMDRLICGDAGYGKTEIAIRAAFKAVMDGKQVAVLAPTTLLSEQHYVTFRERMKDFPVTVAVLNRFRTPQEQKSILKKVEKGEVDIIIGTHRLLQKDVFFKDLGLLIVDEEQRLGVRHKEQLKKLKSNLDVLTLTATPIPRTLYLSLLGLRDISVVETPPEARKPVYTLVMPRDKKVIKEALEREIEREGQVFYVCPRIRNLMPVKEELDDLIPGVKVALAHGRMGGKELEKVMEDFYRGKISVLLCTTIVGIGLDVPNANTIIVDPATLFGLAQLYQLRGRVGRFDREAYAYFLYPPRLTGEARERLEALLEFGATGSGMKLALRDLEIRGAGNILGMEQHGFIQEVGFSLYTRLLEEEIARLRGEEEISSITPHIDLKEEAYLPSFYLSRDSERFYFYQKLLGVRKEKEIEEIKEELEDRFGRLPRQAENLLQITKIRHYAKIAQIESIEEKDGELYFVASLPVLLGLSQYMEERGKEGRLFNYQGREAFKTKMLPLQDLVSLLEGMVIESVQWQSR